jgi:hypothetical protein
MLRREEEKKKGETAAVEAICDTKCSVCQEAQRYERKADRGSMSAMCYIKDKQSELPIKTFQEA